MAESTVSPLRNQLNFPVFRRLSQDNSIDDVYWHTVNGFEYTKKRHWCFLGEIINDDLAKYPFWRNKVWVRDLEGYDQINVSFYPEAGHFNFNSLVKGHTLCVLYGQKHHFLDGTVGLRIEYLDDVKVIPASLSTLLEISDAAPFGQEKQSQCWTCGQIEETRDDGKSGRKVTSTESQSSQGTTRLKKCGSCKVAKYCSKQCQKNDWKLHKIHCALMPEFQSLISINYDNFDYNRTWESSGPTGLSQFLQMRRFPVVRENSPQCPMN